MKKLILIALALTFSTQTFAFDFKKFFSEDLKYNGHFGYGQVNINIENEFDTNLDFTFLYFGGGASYQLTEKYKIFASTSIKKYTNLDFEHDNKVGSKSVSAVYVDWYFGIAWKYKKFMLTGGWDNLNYFLGKTTRVLEPARIDRASLKADYLFHEKFTPSAKLGVLLPVFDDVSGVDINISGRYLITTDKKLSVSGYYYYASLDVDGDDGSSSSVGLSLGYEF